MALSDMLQVLESFEGLDEEGLLHRMNETEVVEVMREFLGHTGRTFATTEVEQVLTAYVIVRFPEYALENLDDLRTEDIEASQALVDAISRATYSNDLTAFSATLDAYMRIVQQHESRRIHKIVSGMKEVVEGVRLGNHVDLFTYARSKEVLDKTRAFVSLVYCKGTGEEAPANLEHANNPRLFLPAYAIVLYPDNVFDPAIPESVTNPVNDLKIAAARLTAAVDAILASPTEDFTNLEPVRVFPLLLITYWRHFRAWKVPDERRLIDRIIHALVELYNAKKTFNTTDPEDVEVMAEYRKQRELVRAKLLQIAGQEALDKFDAEHPDA